MRRFSNLQKSKSPKLCIQNIQNHTAMVTVNIKKRRIFFFLFLFFPFLPVVQWRFSPLRLFVCLFVFCIIVFCICVLHFVISELQFFSEKESTSLHSVKFIMEGRVSRDPKTQC